MRARNLWITTLLLSIIYLIYPVSANAIPTAPSVSLVLATPSPVAGSPFDILVWANGIIDDDATDGIDDFALTGFGFDISAAGLVVGPITFGPSIDDAGPVPGTDVAGIANPFDPPLTGDVLLATLTFTAPVASFFDVFVGTDTFGDGIEGLFITNLNDPFAFLEYDISATYRVEVAASAVPEPGTLMLLSSGIIGVAFFRRRKKI